VKPHPPETRVLTEHIAILREIHAPDELIAVAEHVAAELVSRTNK